MTEACAFVGLGANLGDRLATLQSALDQLGAHADVTVLAASPVYETIPVGPSTEPFLNAAAKLTTGLGPVALLDLLHRIERDHGRERRIRWGARTLDLDLLLYFEPGARAPLRRDDDRCRLPHPAMLERDFVLAPLVDLAPGLVVQGRPLSGHLEALPEAGRTLLRRLDPLRGPG